MKKRKKISGKYRGAKSQSGEHPQMKVIGRREWIDFPDLGLEKINAKIDTGAYTSSLHVHHVEEIEIKGKAGVRFQVLDPDHPEYKDRYFEFPVLKQKYIKSSSGERQRRHIIKTRIRLAGKNYRIELSLADRSRMECPVLLGRKILTRRFLVDVSQKYLTL